jgi:methyltransferase-like protein 22
LVGKQIDLAEVPQYIREYDRGKDLEMWEIMYISEQN